MAHSKPPLVRVSPSVSALPLATVPAHLLALLCLGTAGHAHASDEWVHEVTVASGRSPHHVRVLSPGLPPPPNQWLFLASEDGALALAQCVTAEPTDDAEFALIAGRWPPDTSTRWTGWLLAPDWIARLLPRWPQRAVLIGVIDSIGPGGQTAWVRGGTNQGVRIGDRWWLRVAGQPALRLDVRYATNHLSFCAVYPLATEVTLAPDIPLRLWPAPADRGRSAGRSAVSFVQDEDGRLRVWIPAVAGDFADGGPNLDFFRRGRFLGHGWVERQEEPFWYARFVPFEATDAAASEDPGELRTSLRPVMSGAFATLAPPHHNPTEIQAWIRRHTDTAQRATPAPPSWLAPWLPVPPPLGPRWSPTTQPTPDGAPDPPTDVVELVAPDSPAAPLIAVEPLPDDGSVLRVGDDVIVRQRGDVPSGRFEPRIFEVTSEGALLTAGENDGIAVGDVADVLRGAAVLGRATVVRAQPSYAIVRAVPTAPVDLAQGDRLRFGPPPPLPRAIGRVAAIEDALLIRADLEGPLRVGVPLAVRSGGETIAVVVLLAERGGQGVGLVVEVSRTRPVVAGMSLFEEPALPEAGAKTR